MGNSVFVPGHITGFFNIESHEVALKSGSCGVGFLLDKGVKTTVSGSDKMIFDVNQGDDTIIKEVLSIFDLDETFKITQDIQLPIGSGFGTSAASALSLALAVNQYFDLGYTLDICGQIAHRCEINLGAGLGDVIAQTGKGLVMRNQPGAPGIGEIESSEEDVFVAYKTFGGIETSSVIGDDYQKEVISTYGLKYLDLFKKNPSVENFLECSNSFAHDVALMSDEVEESVNYFNSFDDILGSSMAMLGNTVFAFAYNEDIFKKLDIDGLHICKINNSGIVCE